MYCGASYSCMQGLNACVNENCKTNNKDDLGLVGYKFTMVQDKEEIKKVIEDECDWDIYRTDSNYKEIGEVHIRKT